MTSEVEAWAFNAQSGKKLEFIVPRLVVRKELYRRVIAKYGGKGINFTWNRDKPNCSVEKTKKFNQQDFVVINGEADAAEAEAEESKE